MSQYLSLWRGARSPFLRDMSQVQRALDSMMEDSYGSRKEWTDMGFAPNWDVQETKNHYLVTVDIPGVKKENIKLELHEDRLTISGDRTREVEADTKDKSHHLSEISYGSFARTLAFPHAVDTEKVEANHENGVLKVMLPKAEASKARQISIK